MIAATPYILRDGMTVKTARHGERLCISVVLVVGEVPRVRIWGGVMEQSKIVNMQDVFIPIGIPENWDALCRWVWRKAGGVPLGIGESAPRLYRLPMSSRWRLESAAGDVLHFRGVKTSGDADAPELVPGLADAATPAEALALIVRALS